MTRTFTSLPFQFAILTGMLFATLLPSPPTTALAADQSMERRHSLIRRPTIIRPAVPAQTQEPMVQRRRLTKRPAGDTTAPMIQATSDATQHTSPMAAAVVTTPPLEVTPVTPALDGQKLDDITEPSS